MARSERPATAKSKPDAESLRSRMSDRGIPTHASQLLKNRFSARRSVNSRSATLWTGGRTSMSESSSSSVAVSSRPRIRFTDSSNASSLTSERSPITRCRLVRSGRCRHPLRALSWKGSNASRRFFRLAGGTRNAIAARSRFSRYARLAIAGTGRRAGSWRIQRQWRRSQGVSGLIRAWGVHLRADNRAKPKSATTPQREPPRSCSILLTPALPMFGSWPRHSGVSPQFLYAGPRRTVHWLCRGQ
jgi:hypothetical protein